MELHAHRVPSDFLQHNLSISFGVFIAIRPNSGLATLVYLLGIYAIVFGILYVVGYFQTRSLASSLS